MDWLSIASVALGGIIGSGSTLLADRVRWRRETMRWEIEHGRQEQIRRNESRQGLYVQYLAALSRLRNGLREVAHDSGLTGYDRISRIQTIFLEAGAYELRIQLQIVAPQNVVARSEAAYKSLRKMRIQIEEGASFQDDGYLLRRDDYHRELSELKLAIRDDLGVNP